MNDPRIHKHEFENGKCKLCSEKEVKPNETMPLLPVTQEQFFERIDLLERNVEKRLRWELGEHLFYVKLVGSLTLAVLLIQGCK